jgi:DnaJ-class molecular chaperone
MKKFFFIFIVFTLSIYIFSVEINISSKQTFNSQIERNKLSLEYNRNSFYEILSDVISNIRLIISGNMSKKNINIIKYGIDKKILLLKYILKETDKNVDINNEVISTSVKCKLCGGNGGQNFNCTACGGDGYGYTPDNPVSCGACNGTGFKNGRICGGCDGSGWANTMPDPPKK